MIPAIPDEQVLAELSERCVAKTLEPVKKLAMGKNWQLSDDTLSNLLENCVKIIVAPFEIDENLAELMKVSGDAKVDDGRASVGPSCTYINIL